MSGGGKSWWFTHGDQQLELVAGLDVQTLTRLARLADAPRYSWADVVMSPLIHGEIVAPLVQACCEQLGVPTPERLTAADVIKLFELRDSSLPEVYIDGAPADPKEAAPTTES